jgi:Ca2+/H+ antiporter, TMEM165/GDT1 family
MTRHAARSSAWGVHVSAECGLQEEIHEVEEKLGKRPDSTARRLLRRFCTPVFLEAFLLTFIAEWGDRSQIATITLAAHDDPFGVTLGAIIGHSLCTGAACVGGELLARRISQRTMATAGGILFFLFAAHQFWAVLH